MTMSKESTRAGSEARASTHEVFPYLWVRDADAAMEFSALPSREAGSGMQPGLGPTTAR